MARQPLKSLTESMFYVLLALWRQERCGTEIAAYVRELTEGRVTLGPGTLYAILGKFQEEELIKETWSQGRMRVYRITESGRELFRRELENMRRCVDDGQREMGEEETT
nr:PadR family transcriptional regulator [uncultured Oscillibacter sp.]